MELYLASEPGINDGIPEGAALVFLQDQDGMGMQYMLFIKIIFAGVILGF